MAPTDVASCVGVGALVVVGVALFIGAVAGCVFYGARSRRPSCSLEPPVVTWTDEEQKRRIVRMAADRAEAGDEWSAAYADYRDDHSAAWATVVAAGDAYAAADGASFYADGAAAGGGWGCDVGYAPPEELWAAEVSAFHGVSEESALGFHADGGYGTGCHGTDGGYFRVGAEEGFATDPSGSGPLDAADCFYGHGCGHPSGTIYFCD